VVTGKVTGLTGGMGGIGFGMKCAIEQQQTLSLMFFAPLLQCVFVVSLFEFVSTRQMYQIFAQDLYL